MLAVEEVGEEGEEGGEDITGEAGVTVTPPLVVVVVVVVEGEEDNEEEEAAAAEEVVEVVLAPVETGESCSAALLEDEGQNGETVTVVTGLGFWLLKEDWRGWTLAVGGAESLPTFL